MYSVTEAGESFSMLKSPNVSLMLLTNLVYMPTILSMGQLFVQYFSKRFEVRLTDTGYLLSMRGVVSVFVLLIALPALSKFLLLHISPPERDLLLAKVSALFLTAGFLFLASSHYSVVISGIIVVTFGDGLSPACRSLITNFVESQQTTRLYVMIGFMESIGSIYAGPALAWLFATGMRLNGVWLGLPYIWLALNATLVVIALYCVHLVGQGRQSLMSEAVEIET